MVADVGLGTLESGRTANSAATDIARRRFSFLLYGGGEDVHVGCVERETSIAVVMGR